MNKLAVDLNTNTNNNLGRIKKCDSTELEIILKNGQDYSKCSFRLLGIKADGKRVEQLDNYKLLENKLTFNLNREFTTCEGIVKLELNVFKDHEEITTQTFYFLVSNTLNSEIITSSEDIKTLRDLEHYILVANNALQDTNKTINTLQDASNKIIPVENERIENEAARKQDEKFRTAAEKDRIAAEKVRTKSEDDRNNTEEERQLNENTRQSNELKRKTAENLRVKREDAREAAEVLRQDLFEENEGIRNESENTRIKNENKRILSENIRIENENNRILQEEDRQKKEDIRIKNEDLRAAAEKIREQQEANREKHYNDFNNAESDRVKAEKIREQKETERMSAESKRNELYNEAEKKRDLSFEEAEKNRSRIYNEAENERAENEKNRIIAESKRNSKEDIRINSEKLRVAAESKREQQEANRNNTFEESQRNREELYKVAENKRKQAESARVEAEKIREQQEYERIEAEKIREEKIKEFGLQVTKNKNDIADNSKDIERAFETINDNSFIPFTGEDISVEHSKVGFTKDMQIEGLTYQNLHEKQTYSFVTDSINNNKYTKTESENSIVVNITDTLQSWFYINCGKVNLNMLKPNTKYTIVGDFENIASVILQSGDAVYAISKAMPVINNKIVVLTTNEMEKTEGILVYCNIAPQTTGKVCAKNIMILEGDYTNVYVPKYFEGIKSVGGKENKVSILSCNKNLIDINSYVPDTNINDVVTIIEDNKLKVEMKRSIGWKLAGYINIPVKKNTTYTFGRKIEVENYGHEQSSWGCGLITIKSNGNVNAPSLNEVNNPSSDFPNGKGSNTRTVRFNSSNSSFITFRIQGTTSPVKTDELAKFIISDLFLYEEDNLNAKYEPYKSNKKEILLPFSDGLKGLPSGVKDITLLKEDGLYIRQNLERRILNGTENWRILSSDPETYIYFEFDINAKISNNINIICDKFTPRSFDLLYQKNTDGIAAWSNNTRGTIFLGINKSKLETPDVTGFKRWLQDNETTIIFELLKPVEHKIADLNSINLETFKDVTYVSSENEIQPKLSFKAPVDIPKTISSLRNANTMLIAQNVGLENKNKQLEKVNNKQTEKINQLDEATTALISSALM